MARKETIAEFRFRMEKENSGYLQRILDINNTIEWSEEKLETIAEILRERYFDIQQIMDGVLTTADEMASLCSLIGEIKSIQTNDTITAARLAMNEYYGLESKFVTFKEKILSKYVQYDGSVQSNYVPVAIAIYRRRYGSSSETLPLNSSPRTNLGTVFQTMSVGEIDFCIAQWESFWNAGSIMGDWANSLYDDLCNLLMMCENSIINQLLFIINSVKESIPEVHKNRSIYRSSKFNKGTPYNLGR